MTDEARHAAPVTPTELTARLAEHRCLNDGKPLTDASPSDLYCNSDCQHAWHKIVHPAERDGHTPMAGTGLGRDYEPSDVRAEGPPPGWLGDNRSKPWRDPEPQPPPQDRPGMLAGTPTPTSAPDTIGASVVDTALALEEISTEPGGWYQVTATPVSAAAEDAGVVAMGGGVVQAVHPCHIPGCEHCATTWYLLGAALVLAGWQWNPVDNEALRIGLCSYHTMRLRYMVVHPDNHLVKRMIVSTRTSIRDKSETPRLKLA